MAAVAQEEYDAWEQDSDGVSEELGTGGICDLIADRMCLVLAEAGFDCEPVNSEGMGENHTWVEVDLEGQVIAVDIPYWSYEIGAGYTWKKRHGVQLTAADVGVP